MTKTFTLLLLIFFCLKADAAKIAGADITFTTLKNKQIQVNLTRYRLLNDKDTQSPRIGLLIGNYIVYQVATLVAQEIQSVYCDTVNYYDSARYEAVKVEYFKVIFDLGTHLRDSLVKQFCKVRFFYTDSSRSGQITTFDGTKKFYIESMLNYCLMGNKEISPQFPNKPAFIVPCNLSYSYNCGFIEPAGTIDSFSFALSDAQDSIGRKLKYNDYGYDGRIPLAPYCLPPGTVNCQLQPYGNPAKGFYFNELIGDMIFTPTQCKEMGVIVVRINLYSNDSNNNKRSVGYITREMTTSVLPSAANNRIFSNIQNTYSICEGGKFCLTVKSPSTYNTNDTQHLSWNNTLPGATLTITDSNAIEQEATLCWQTKPGDGRNEAYHFTMIATVNNCPAKTIKSKGFQVFVKPNPYPIQKHYRHLICNRLALQADNVNNYKTINWKVYDQSNKLIATASRFTDTIQLIPPYSSVYFVKATINNHPVCFDTDTVINAKLNGSYSRNIDTGICRQGNTLDLKNHNPYKYKNAQWTDEYDIPVDNDTFNLTGYHFPISTYFVLNISPNTNCNIRDTFHFTIFDTARKILPDLDLCETSAPLNLFGKGITQRQKGIWQSMPANAIDTAGYTHFTKGVSGYLVYYYYDSSFCMNYEQIKVNLEKSFKASFTADKTSGPPPLTVNFTNKTTGTNLTYFWNFGDPKSSGNTTTFTNPFHTFDSSGTYSIMLCAKGVVCTDTLIKANHIVVKAIQNNLTQVSNLYLNIYPNPTNGKIHIELDETFKLSVTDVTGKTILMATDAKLIELPKGVFFLRIETRSYFEIRKVVVF